MSAEAAVANEIVRFKRKSGEGGVAEAPRSTFEALYQDEYELVDDSDQPVGPRQATLEELREARENSSFADVDPDSGEKKASKAAKGGDQ
jgi:hypothetical protein